MESKKYLEVYLRKIIEFCEAYDAFAIPAAMMAGGTEIKLQDVYTYIKPVPVERETYEENGSTFLDGNLSRNSLLNHNRKSTTLLSNTFKEELSDIDSLIAKIDARIAELEAEESQNKEEKVEEFTEKKELNWKWFLSAPGGGKTTLLKMYSLAYAYRYYEELFGRNEQVFQDWKAIEDICDQIGVSKGEGACPFFISVRELQEEDYPNIENAVGFKRVIFDTIKFLIEDDVVCFDLDEFLNQTSRKIYIVDSVEEFASEKFRNDFLIGLDNFSSGDKCYLSSRYREYMENVKEARLEIDGIELTAQEFVIEGLQKDIVRKFVDKWYAALNKVSGRKKLDVDNDFLIPLYKNANVKNLISNPLELTSLLMISSYDSYLPSDYAKIYGRSIELWLSWNNYARYNYEDVMRQLSQIAYKMAISEHEKIVVKQNTLVQYIRESRRELRRYYQQEWQEDEESINEFIQFLCRSHLISRSTEGYDFVHRQYQAYLVAYCISTNNFSRETRRKSKFNYIEEHIREKDDFWNQIYKIISIIDIELRDDIITTLFDLSDNKDDSSNDNNYYVSRLIELAIIPGVNFDEYEREKLMELIIQDENRWRLFESKKVDLFELLRLNDKYSNELLIKAAIRKNDELPECDKDKFRDTISETLFYCIWNCTIGEQCVKEVLTVFFTNFINTAIIEMIYNTKELTVQQILVKNILCCMGKETVEAGGYSDYYMLIAVILGYEDNPYICVDRLILEKNFESDIIAINILIIATWLLRCKKASRFGYGLSLSDISKYSDFILNGILCNNIIQRDYLAAFSDIFAIGATRECEETWFHKDVFETVLRSALSEYEKDGTFFDERDGSFSRSFEHVSLYPCNYSDVCKSFMDELNINSQPIAEKLKDLYHSTNDIMIKIRSLKLLILLSNLEYNDRTGKVIEIENQWNDLNVKRQLRNDDLEIAYSESIRQIKEYVPEGQQILEELDFNNFILDYSLVEDKDIDIPNEIKTNDSDVEYHDYYAEGRYEEAKRQFLSSFGLLSSRNNLAYMLRRKEITSVVYNGVNYSVEMLLQEGVAEKEPYSIMNYALYISYENGYYNYGKGLTFLEQYKDSVHLLDASRWWYKLKKEGELEGYVVSMWLCDLDLSIFETKDELQEQSEMLFLGQIKY